MAKTLGPDAFADFFEAIHEVEPFPWQVRLAKQVIEEGRWPGVLDLPTGVGKTAALDVAVFALAVDAQRGEERRAPIRTAFVVDRRVVVDQTFTHARKLADALRVGEASVIQRVRDVLRAAFDCEQPLTVAVLRGGIPRDDGWARSPSQPLIAVSTVDQVGSRLLFRGYGISDRMKPVHAGLLGHDTLFLLDEVHLAAPFAETLSTIQQSYRKLGRMSGDRWGVACMSATPIAAAGMKPFRLANEDREHPVLRKRLEASKPARLLRKVEVGDGDADSKRSRLARACASAVHELLASELKTILVVVNRVDTARRTWSELRGMPDVDVRLLTGRMRPVDKDRVANEVMSAIGAKRDRSAPTQPIVVVATQSIEAGADLDVEGLVTECASIDALRQRFGRLNRRGEYERCAARILIGSDQTSKSDDDPVYGSALAATWKWLELKGRDLDFGITALEVPIDEREALVPQSPCAPVLLPGHLDSLAQTCPRPHPDPEVAHWLHGLERGVPDVQVVWRADLTADQLGRCVNDFTERNTLIADLSAVRPGSIEALAVPLHAARSWLMSAADLEGSDSERERTPEPVRTRERSRSGRPFVRWNGDESDVTADPTTLVPGDTIVVPSAYGGVTAGNWDPTAIEEVTDLGDLVQWIQRRRPTLRLDARVIGPWLTHCPGLAPLDPDGDDLEEQVDVRLRSIAAAETIPAGEWLQDVVKALRRGPRRKPIALGPEASPVWMVTSRRRLEPTGPAAVGEDYVDETTEDETSPFTGARVTLNDHSTHVETHARAFAERCGLGRPLVNDLALAGWLHDIGKVDPRFQQILCGGNEVAAAMLDEPLAKSDMPKLDKRGRERARERAGYPKGTRHELMSVAVVQDVDAVRAKAEDWDLVLHLVASHHGWCRPFPPAVEDESGPTVRHQLTHAGFDFDVSTSASANHGLSRLDAGIAERFWALVRRYGWFGLSYLETILRLADHRASAEEEDGQA